MQIRELSKPITSKMLNENLAKNFGYKINFEQFNDVQLEDARNKLRTKLSQFEVNESYDSLHDSRDYQKTRMFLDCINQEIMEREESKCEDCGKVHDGECIDESSDEKEGNDMEENMNESYITHAVRNRAKKLSVPESWINSTLDKIRAGEDDREELKAELTVRYDLNESQASWILLEGEEDKAKVIMATKDMVDRVTGWLEDTAAMKAEQLLELQDSIRETLGSDVAQQYGDAVKPALEAVYTALETSRQGLQGALALVSGGEAPMMGATPSPDAMGAPAMPDAEPMLGAQGGMAPEETPPGPELDRMKRESVDYSRRLGQLLAQSKKK
jgi:hypothetical protein